MAVISHQLTTSTTAAPVISGAVLTNVTGSITDPLPLQQEITTLFCVAASGTPILAILASRQ